VKIITNTKSNEVKSVKFKHLIYKFEDGLGIIELNRPQAMNALCAELTYEIGELLTELENSPELRVLILTGNRKVFAAGADIGDMMDKGTLDVFPSIIKINKVVNQLDELPVPTIAAINGPCMGGGCELALCCDFRIAGENAQFALPEVSRGVIPGSGGTQRLPLIVGLAQAKEMILLNKMVMADEALKIGLVNKVVADDEVMNEARALAVRLMKKPAVALRFAKESINFGVKNNFNTGMNMELSRFAMCFSSEDQKEGMKAFFEKRKPVYKNK
jgi:enoyl-CoA hydratase/carnithine racemase